MNRCPITYEICETKYSRKGLNLFSRSLKELNDFPFTAKQQIELAAKYADKLSIQGIQPKLSVRLDNKSHTFAIAESKGAFILKPPHLLYDQLPQNEDVTMRLAEMVDIKVPVHGLIYNIDGSLSYFIKRFDRDKKHKLGVEDFSQLLGFSRDTKYDASMEKLIPVISKYCTFQVLEKLKLFRIVLFNFLVGNEDAHLKNFSLIRRTEIIEMSPSYDLVNFTIVTKTKEEIALPLNGKKSNLKKADFIDYFGQTRLGLPSNMIGKEMATFEKIIPEWKKKIRESFLSKEMIESYEELIDQRWERVR